MKRVIKLARALHAQILAMLLSNEGSAMNAKDKIAQMLKERREQAGNAKPVVDSQSPAPLPAATQTNASPDRTLQHGATLDRINAMIKKRQEAAVQSQPPAQQTSQQNIAPVVEQLDENSAIEAALNDGSAAFYYGGFIGAEEQQPQRRRRRR